MSLRPCPICKKEISYNASMCPSCGESDPLRNERKYDYERAKDKFRRDSGTPLKLSGNEESEVNNLIQNLIIKKEFWKAVRLDSKSFGLKLMHSHQRIKMKSSIMGLSSEFDKYEKKNFSWNKIGCMIFVPIFLLFLIYWFVLGGYKNI
ncbi:MAG: hypothetical protein ACKO5Y_02915 [Bacteroidota bacterium]